MCLNVRQELRVSLCGVKENLLDHSEPPPAKRQKTKRDLVEEEVDDIMKFIKGKAC